MTSPRVFTAPAFLDVFTCRRIQRAMDAGAAEPAEILAHGIARDDDVRRAANIEIEPEAIELVERRLEALRGTLSSFFGLALREREGTSFLRYHQGGFYKPHRDRGVMADWPGATRRQVAVIVFLNSSRAADPRGDFAGGVLRLQADRDAMDVEPVRGLSVAFPADVLHEVLTVTAGTRDTIVDWFY